VTTSTVVRDAGSFGALDPSVICRWVQRTCAAQGLPVVVTDATVLAKVATLLGGSDHGRSNTVPAVT
jgi:hypothetical protein